MTEKQKKFLPRKEDKDRLCLTLARIMRQLYNVIERSFWPKGTETKSQNYLSGFLCPGGLNLISFIAFYSAKKDLSKTLNSCIIIVAKVEQGLSLSSFPVKISFVAQSFLH